MTERVERDRSTAARATRAFVLHPDIRSAKSRRLAEHGLAEAISLANALPELDVVGGEVIRLPRLHPGMLFGSGKVDDLKARFKAEDIALVLVDGPVSPVQQRNLEKEWGVKLLDRTGLILEIFADRARTREGVLQVELAALSYQRTRLVRAWTHLERQRGGFGFLGGPGETQIEADRRMIRQRMGRLRRDLEQVKKTRALHRDRRGRAPWPVVALVGYTNAGKSTLFNRLTGAEVMAEDLLFATLDPTMRAIGLPGVEKAILSDTVGFISDLPTQLVAAFRATLEEVTAADVICHVRDMANPSHAAQKKQVLEVLADLGVVDGETGTSSIPILEVWNKCDLLDADSLAELQEAAAGQGAVILSAATGEGVDALEAELARLLTGGAREVSLLLPVSDGRRMAWLHAHGEVLADDDAGDSDAGPMRRVTVRLGPKELGQFVSLV